MRLIAPIAATVIATMAGGSGLAQGSTASGLNPLGSIGLSTLRGFRERPLFSASRREPQPPAVSSSPAPPPAANAQPSLRLTGVIEGPEERVAVVQDLDGKDTWQVRLGDRISGWLVTDIKAVSMQLTLGDRDEEYRLFATPR